MPSPRLTHPTVADNTTTPSDYCRLTTWCSSQSTTMMTMTSPPAAAAAAWTSTSRGFHSTVVDVWLKPTKSTAKVYHRHHVIMLCILYCVIVSSLLAVFTVARLCSSNLHSLVQQQRLVDPATLISFLFPRCRYLSIFRVLLLTN